MGVEVEPGQYETSLVGVTFQETYLLDELVGYGSTAWVYRASHLRLQDHVAVKLLLPELVQIQEALLRFQAEARNQFKLKHPNIVQVVDLIEDRGFHGIVMEWINGRDLKTFLGRLNKLLQVGQVLELFLPILEGVEHAHDMGLVHRDLKPANILLHRSGNTWTPKVSDFGIAKALSGGQPLTTAGNALGTLSYMSPEQIQGHSAIDIRADIYSLGVILYQLLVGALPFRAKGQNELMEQHIYEPPPPPHTLSHEIPEELSQIVLQCLAKAPENRFQSCSSLLYALENFQQTNSADATVVASMDSWFSEKLPYAPPQESEPLGKSDPLLPEPKLGLHRILVVAMGALAVFMLVRIVQFPTKAKKAKERTSAVLIVSTKPSGAEVWIQGKRVGRTPHRIHAAVGAHKAFVLKRQKYLPQSLKWHASKAGLTRRTFILKPNTPSKPSTTSPTIRVVIATVPPQADVIVQGNKIGQTPHPLSGKEGQILGITLLMKGYAQTQKKLHLSNSTPKKITITLRKTPRAKRKHPQGRQSAYLFVTSIPRALVYIRGKRKGLTPMRIQGTLGETLRVSFFARGYRSTTKAFTLSKTRTTAPLVSLARRQSRQKPALTAKDVANIKDIKGPPKKKKKTKKGKKDMFDEL